MSDLYLVTGGAGFIGNHIVRALLDRGDRVRVFDNFATGHRQNVSDILDDIELVEGDLRSADACRKATLGARHIIHQAALPSVPRSLEDPHTSHEVNATGTLHLLIAARDAGAKRFVYASSSSVYGPEPKMPREESDRPHPISPYAVSKLSGEQYCTAFFHSYGLETVALRYFNIFGPRQHWDSPYAAVLPKFIRALRRSEPVTIHGDGEQARDFTYVDNAVAANLLAIDATDAPGKMFNVGAGQRTTVNAILKMTAAALGLEANATYGPVRRGDVRDSLASIERSRQLLGYAPSVSVEQGVKQTVNWTLAQPD